MRVEAPSGQEKERAEERAYFPEGSGPIVWPLLMAVLWVALIAIGFATGVVSCEKRETTPVNVSEPR